jgi:dihydroneopterin aldolase
LRDQITIDGIRAFGFHGVLDQEKRDGQEFVVDLELEVSFDAAVTHDSLELTVDYSEVASRVVAIVERDRFDLIETLCARIIEMLLTYENIHAARVTVHKPKAPLEVPFSGVSVAMRRQRNSS